MSATLFLFVEKSFMDTGLHLITKLNDFTINDKSCLQDYKFTFKGPCGHTRRGTIEESKKFCSICLRQNRNAVVDKEKLN